MGLLESVFCLQININHIDLEGRQAWVFARPQIPAPSSSPLRRSDGDWGNVNLKHKIGMPQDLGILQTGLIMAPKNRQMLVGKCSSGSPRYDLGSLIYEIWETNVDRAVFVP